MSEIVLQAPQPHQSLVIDADFPRKLWRAGRRTGKTRGDLYASVVGHGPFLPNGERKYKAMVHGKDVVWLAPDFPQALGVWREEIIPRFKGRDGIRVNENEHSVGINGLGTLWLRSHENAASIRGLGKNLGGVIIDEGAHFDLELDWGTIISPALADNEGWAIFSSTANSGPDGNPARTGGPSYFNILCAQVMAGEKGKDWAHWHQDARLNRKITPRAFQTLVAEMTSARAVEEEVYANLLQQGAGLAFPEWDRSIHIRPTEPDNEWSCACGMDWGYSNPGWFGMVYTGPRQELVLRHEWYFDHVKSTTAGRHIAQMCLASPVWPEYIALDAACWNVTDGSPTIAEKLEDGMFAEIEEYNARLKLAEVAKNPRLKRTAVPFWPAPKGPSAIVTQKMLTHEVLAFARDEDGVVVSPPKLVVHPDCKDFARTIALLPLDEKDNEKFSSKGEDHPLQGFAYLLGTRQPDFVPPLISREVAEARRHLDPISRQESDEWLKMEQKIARRPTRR